MRTLLVKSGFTLIEMLVAITVLVILLGILFSITNTVAKAVVTTSVKIDAFASGRAGFDLMGQKLSQATLNTYWDYDNPLAPSNYVRQSDLQFLVRQSVHKSGSAGWYGQEVYFATPAAYANTAGIRATDGLLNACGFFVSYGPDTSFKPGVIPAAMTRYRYRLIQGLEPTENLATYSNWAATPTGTNATNATYWNSTYWPAMATFWSTHAWINNTIGNNAGTVPANPLNTNDVPLASNVIALIVWPHLSTGDDPSGSTTDGSKLTANYTYDSQANAMTVDASGLQSLTANQLPPIVQITMIVISEPSAARIDTHTSTPPAVIEAALNGKFVTSTYTAYQTDLASVGTSLTAAHISYEILNTSITMKESKWSDNSQ